MKAAPVTAAILAHNCRYLAMQQTDTEQIQEVLVHILNITMRRASGLKTKRHKYTVADSETIIPGLQDEIRRNEESRYDHRLHGLLLVAHGMTCPEAAALLGDAPRTVEHWVRGFEEKGLAALREGERSGRPGRLSDQHLRGIDAALRRMPRELGLGGNVWDGKTLAAWIQRQYGIVLGVRQCQRLFRRLGFRLRKSPPAIAEGCKKTPRADGE